MRVVTKTDFRNIFRERNTSSHKGDFGHLLVVGGSVVYHGSPVFNALAAYSTGVDLVTVVGPRRAMDLAACCGGPDLITYPLSGDFFVPDHLDTVTSLTQDKTAVVIGGGMGRRSETLQFIKLLLDRVALPMVLDADAIYAVAESPQLLGSKASLITPHQNEFKKLIGKETVLNFDSMVMDELRNAACKFKSTILLKGATDLISDGEKVVQNKEGSPYMTVGGTGDTLAGICGSLLAQGVDAFRAACVAAYINGKAGKLAAADFGPSMMASDVLSYIPDVIRRAL